MGRRILAPAGFAVAVLVGGWLASSLPSWFFPLSIGSRPASAIDRGPTVAEPGVALAEETPVSSKSNSNSFEDAKAVPADAPIASPTASSVAADAIAPLGSSQPLPPRSPAKSVDAAASVPDSNPSLVKLVGDSSPELVETSAEAPLSADELLARAALTPPPAILDADEPDSSVSDSQDPDSSPVPLESEPSIGHLALPSLETSPTIMPPPVAAPTPTPASVSVSSASVSDSALSNRFNDPPLPSDGSRKELKLSELMAMARESGALDQDAEPVGPTNHFPTTILSLPTRQVEDPQDLSLANPSLAWAEPVILGLPQVARDVSSTLLAVSPKQDENVQAASATEADPPVTLPEPASTTSSEASRAAVTPLGSPSPLPPIGPGLNPAPGGKSPEEEDIPPVVGLPPEGVKKPSGSSEPKNEISARTNPESTPIPTFKPEPKSAPPALVKAAPKPPALHETEEPPPIVFEPAASSPSSTKKTDPFAVPTLKPAVPAMPPPSPLDETKAKPEPEPPAKPAAKPESAPLPATSEEPKSAKSGDPFAQTPVPDKTDPFEGTSTSTAVPANQSSAQPPPPPRLGDPSARIAAAESETKVKSPEEEAVPASPFPGEKEETPDKVALDLSKDDAGVRKTETEIETQEPNNSAPPSGNANPAAPVAPPASEADPNAGAGSKPAEPSKPAPTQEGLPATLPADRLSKGLQALGLSVNVRSPESINIGKQADVAVDIKNVETVEVPEALVRVQLPETVDYVSSQPEATSVSGQIVTWKLGSVAAESSKELIVRVKAKQPGLLEFAATVTAISGARSRATAVLEPKLDIKVKATGATRVAKGRSMKFEIEVSNPGTGIVREPKIQAELSSGLKHEQQKNEKDNVIYEKLKVLKAGETKTLPPFEVMATASGDHVINWVALSDDVLEVDWPSRSITVTVVEPLLKVKLVGPERRYTDTIATYDLVVENPGTAPTSNIKARAMIPVGGLPLLANGQTFNERDRTLSWTLPALDPGKSQVFKFDVRMSRAANFRISAEADADANLRSSDSWTTEVVGIADLAFTVDEKKRVLDVGMQTEFEVTIENRGTKEARAVQIDAKISPNLKVISTSGTKEEAKRNRKTNDIVFPPIDRIEPGRILKLKIKVEGVDKGTASCEVSIKHADLGDVPIRKTAVVPVTEDRRASP